MNFRSARFREFNFQIRPLSTLWLNSKFKKKTTLKKYNIKIFQFNIQIKSRTPIPNIQKMQLNFYITPIYEIHVHIVNSKKRYTIYEIRP